MAESDIMAGKPSARNYTMVNRGFIKMNEFTNELKKLRAKNKNKKIYSNEPRKFQNIFRLWAPPPLTACQNNAA